jgi:hypothetical protein
VVLYPKHQVGNFEIMIKTKLFAIKDYSNRRPLVTLLICLFLPMVTFLITSLFFDIPVVARVLFIMAALLLVGPARWAFIKVSKDKK